MDKIFYIHLYTQSSDSLVWHFILDLLIILSLDDVFMLKRRSLRRCCLNCSSTQTLSLNYTWERRSVKSSTWQHFCSFWVGAFVYVTVWLMFSNWCSLHWGFPLVCISNWYPLCPRRWSGLGVWVWGWIPCKQTMKTRSSSCSFGFIPSHPAINPLWRWALCLLSFLCINVK